MKVLEIKSRPLVFPSQMKDGDIGIIRESQIEVNVGIVVQRYGDVLMSLGKSRGHSWDSIIPANGDSISIEILPKGTTLEI